MVQAYDAVQEAEKLRKAGRLDRARSVCALALKPFPDYVAALYTMGLILADQSQYDKALEPLHRALMLNPQDPQILIALSGVYLKLDSHLMAARTLEQASEISPNDANILVTLAEIYREQKEYELAKGAYEAALEAEPTLTVAEFGLLQNLMDIGELEKAAEIVQKHVRGGSRTLFLLYTLSQLPTALVDLDPIPLLDEIEPGAKKISPEDFKAQAAFTKASAFDKAGRHEEAWEQVNRARRYNSAEARNGFEKYRKRHQPLLEIARNVTADFDANGRTPPELPISLFIVGPSRSGKTTLERLIGSLPDVKRGYENPIVENAVRRSFQTAGFPTKNMLTQLPPGLGDKFRGFYIEELTQRAESAKVLTNTLPTRTEDAIRAAIEIPNSRFVFIKRDLNDLSIRIFMKNYATGNFHASKLSYIHEYLTWCHEMIDAMAEKMPEIARVITYEEMVADPKAALDMTAELCGLDASGVELPPIGDDRGCGQPYREKIKEAIGDSA